MYLIPAVFGAPLMKGTGTDVPIAGREESPWGELPAAPSRRRAFIPAAVPSVQLVEKRENISISVF